LTPEITAVNIICNSKASLLSRSGRKETLMTESKPPFFPDNIQFWYETKRAFGAGSYGGSEFGEVMAG
jgi:hypothetical protein